MKRYFLSLGGNMGDRAAMLAKARALIGARCGTITAESSLYETEAWGMQGDPFLNQAICVESALGAARLMHALHGIEAHLGRTRTANGYESRPIDIDILLANGLTTRIDGVTIPHPRMHERRFVLQPLSEIAGDAVHPVLGKTISALLAECRDMLDVTIYRG